MMFQYLALAAAAWLVSASEPPSRLCDQARAIVNLVCVESVHGVALAGDEARAKRLLELAEGGVGRFKEYFGRQPLRYAVAEGPDAVIAREQIAALRKAGFKVVLPWLSDNVFRRQIEGSIRRGVEAQMAGQPAEAIDAAVKASVDRQMDPVRRAKVESGAVPHELGHDWFRVGYWPEAPLGEDKHYGGPSPDWLDEMSAVLMEAPDMFDDRIRQFAKRYAAYRANPEKADESTRLMIDLPNFFGEVHPASAQVRALNDQRSAEEKKEAVRIISGEEGRKIAEGSVRFYLQSAVASQYLIERTGDRKVFARIAEAFVRGETIEQWLANREPKGNLPSELKAMQADWLNWLEKRFPAEAPKAA